MADHAVFNNGFVLKRKWPLVLAVTPGTQVIDRSSFVFQHTVSAVDFMTTCTDHLSLKNRMMGGQAHFCLLPGMTGVTQIRFRSFKGFCMKSLPGPGGRRDFVLSCIHNTLCLVDLMAVGT